MPQIFVVVSFVVLTFRSVILDSRYRIVESSSVRWHNLLCQVSSVALGDWFVASPRFALFAELDSIVGGKLTLLS